MLWKVLVLAAGSPSPVVVVLSGSMLPAFSRGDILFLTDQGPHVNVGDVVVFNVSDDYQLLCSDYFASRLLVNICSHYFKTSWIEAVMKILSKCITFAKLDCGKHSCGVFCRLKVAISLLFIACYASMTLTVVKRSCSQKGTTIPSMTGACTQVRRIYSLVVCEASCIPLNKCSIHLRSVVYISLWMVTSGSLLAVWNYFDMCY